MKYLFYLFASTFAFNLTNVRLNEEETIWETPKTINAITKTDDTHYSLNLTYYDQIITGEYSDVYMWANLTVFDGPVPADDTYFFNYMQIE